MAALRDSTGAISPRERERVLESHGITPADLLRFVEVWGEEDPATLQEVWDEVQEGIREAREEAALERLESDPAGSPSSSSEEPAGSGEPGDS